MRKALLAMMMGLVLAWAVNGCGKKEEESVVPTTAPEPAKGAEGGDAPAEGGEKPAEGGDAPAEGGDAPAEGGDKPAEGGDKPAEAPAEGGDK